MTASSIKPEDKTEKLKLQFDPNTIEHLGISLYSKLPSVLSELISNSWDADAENVSIDFIANDDTLKMLEDEDRIAFRYNKGKNGNPNGSTNRIAGILNKKRNVLGMMPHPERAVESILGSDDGIDIFKSMIGVA